MNAIKIKAITRKFAICLAKGCMQCELKASTVPEDCEWALKHVLDTSEEGVVIDRPRRSGKTSAILHHADRFQQLGIQSIVILPTAEMASWTQKRIMGTGIMVASVGGWGDTFQMRTKAEKILMGHPRLAVFSDEVGDWIVDVVNKNTRHRFILGLWTSR